MGSPFEFLSKLAGGEDRPAPGPGQGGITPREGTIFSMLGIGRTIEQRKAEVEGATLAELGRLHQKTGNPQRAIVEFMNSQQGQELMSQQGGTAVLDQFVKAVTPPTPQLSGSGAPGGQMFSATPGKVESLGVTPFAPGTGQTTLRPGEELYGPGKGDGTQADRIAQVPHAPGTGEANVPAGEKRVAAGGATIATNKTAPVQTFEGLAQHINDPSSLAKLAELSIAGTDPAIKAMEVDRLIKAGQISPEFGDKFLTGIISVGKRANYLNEEMPGVVVYDSSKGTATVLDPNQVLPGGTSGGTARGAQAGTGGGSTAKNPDPNLLPSVVKAPDGSVDLQRTLQGNKLNMYLGVGILPTALSYLGSSVRQFNPANSEEKSLQAQDQRNNLQALHSAVVNLASAEDGRLKMRAVELQKMVPGFGPMQDVRGAIRQGLLLHNQITGMLAQEQQIIKDAQAGTMSREAAKRAEKNIQLLQDVLNAMPTAEQHQALYDSLSTPQSGATNLVGAARTALGLGASGARDLAGSAQSIVNNPTGQPAPQPGAPQAQSQGQPQAQPQAAPQAQPVPAADKAAVDAIKAADLPKLNEMLPSLATMSEAAKGAYVARLQELVEANRKQPAASSSRKTPPRIRQE